jgi:hypothetical protein
METLAVIFAMAALFLWVRSEANADRRYISEIQRQDRKDILTLVEAIKEDVRAIKEEMKDFHNRLCAIEERRGK